MLLFFEYFHKGSLRNSTLRLRHNSYSIEYNLTLSPSEDSLRQRLSVFIKLKG